MGRSIRFLHTADIHLHAPFTYLNKNFTRRQRDLRQNIKRMQEFIQNEQIPFWFIAGDLWEHELVTPPTIAFLQKTFAEIPNTRIIISPGNHDPITQESYYRSIDWSPNVTIFSDEWETHVLDEWNLAIYGKGFGDVHQTDNPLLTFPGKQVGIKHHIMIIHGSVTGWAGGAEHSPYAPMSLLELEQLEMDYIALGHIHKPHIFYNREGDVIAAYPGSPESLRSSETGPRHVLIGEWRNGRIQVTEVPAHVRLFRNVEIDVSGSSYLEQLTEKVEQILLSFSEEEMLHIRLTGEISRHLHLDHSFFAELGQKFFYIDWKDDTVPDYDLEQIKNEGTLLSLFLQKVEEALVDEMDEHIRSEIEEAQYVILDSLLRKEVKL